MARTALILGVSGQDGSYMAQFLLKKGYRVVGCSRNAEVRHFSNLVKLKIFDDIEIESVYLRDFRRVLEVLRKVRPDEVYNLAGQSSVGLSFEQPFETFQSISVATLNLLDALLYLNEPARLFNASTGECFGDTDGLRADESTPFHPRSPYGTAKAAGFWKTANYREAYGLYACSGLLFNHESPLRHERFVTRKIVNAACRIARGSREKLFLGNVSVERDWGWAPEYVEAMWRMLQQERPEDYVIATGETNTLKDFVEAAFACLDMDWKEHVEIRKDLFRPADISKMRADPGKAWRELGWKARHRMRDVVKMMVEAQWDMASR